MQAYISKLTSRDYVKMRDAFSFFGATTENKDLENGKWLEFN